jgi:hypothetical protein
MYVTRIPRYIYTYSVRYYPQFHVTAVGLGTYYLCIRWHTCIFMLHTPFQIIYMDALVSTFNKTGIHTLALGVLYFAQTE